MLIVYTGNGKGKTCAAVGQALRAIGNNMSVAFGQFFKCDDIAGEQRILKQLLGERFRAAGPGFFYNEKEREYQRQCALGLLQWALAQDTQVTVLDEIIGSYEKALLECDEIMPLLEYPHNRIVVFTGRNAPVWMTAKADIVTEMLEVKHWHQYGSGAMSGVEL